MLCDRAHRIRLACAPRRPTSARFSSDEPSAALAASAVDALDGSSPPEVEAGALVGFSALLAASLGSDGLLGASCEVFFWFDVVSLLLDTDDVLDGPLGCCFGAALAAAATGAFSDESTSSALLGAAVLTPLTSLLTIADQPVLSGGGWGALSAWHTMHDV